MFRDLPLDWMDDDCDIEGFPLDYCEFDYELKKKENKMAKTENELKDLTKAPLLTIEDVQREQMALMRKLTANEVRLAGTIRGLRVSEGKQRFKKDDKGNYTDEPVLDDQGNVQFWANKYYVTLAFEGGELDILVSEDSYNNLQMGNRVLFEGSKGTRFGQVQDIFHSHTVLM